MTNNTYIKSILPGSSRKLDVLLCLPRTVALKLSGASSSLENWESRLLRRDAKYARPRPLGDDGRESEAFSIVDGSSVHSVKSDVDL